MCSPMELTSSYGLHLAFATGEYVLVLFNEVNVKILNSVPGDYTTPRYYKDARKC
jgi:hypothetical protein